MSDGKITTLFVDIGGVLLTPGWDRPARVRASKFFRIDDADFEDRHHLAADLYEVGRFDLATYLDQVVFHTPQRFEREEFRSFMFAQSFPHDPVLSLVRELKLRHGLRVVAVSNEGRELAQHRIQAFHLGAFTDFFLVSSFVRCRKPDAEIYRMALEVAQVSPERVAYLEDRKMFAEIAAGLGMHAIHHTNVDSSRAAFAELGLTGSA